MNAPLEYGKYYHIYNRGNNYENIFQNNEDYLHFLNVYDIYISPVADTFAWCLMKNHFHILVRIKNEDEIGFLNSDYSNSDNIELKWKTFFPMHSDARYVRKPIPAQQFKHLFNSYSRWFNKRHQRFGALFEKDFERKIVDNEMYYINLIVYIHNNPIKHGFVEHTLDYPWTSYLSISSTKPTKLKRDDVIRYFDNLENFKHQHVVKAEEYEKLIQYLIIE